MSIELGVARRGRVFGPRQRDLEHHLGEAADRIQIVRIADVVDLAVRDAARVVDDAGEAVDRVVDEGEGARLAAAIDQFDRLAAHDVAEELRQHARAALLRIIHAVEPRADPIERTEQRELQALLAVAPDDPIEQLLDAGVDPALLVDGAQHQLGGLRIEFLVAARAVDFRGRGKHHPLLVLHAVADDRQVRLEIQFEHPQRLAHVSGGRGDRHQRQDHIAFAHLVLDPFLVDGDVALDEVEPRIAEHRADPLRLQIHAVDMPIGVAQDVLAQVMADEAVDAENENVFQDEPLRDLMRIQVSAHAAALRQRRAARRCRARRAGCPIASLQDLEAPAVRRSPRTNAPSAAYRHGALAAWRAGSGSTRVSSTSSLHPFTSVKAPGNGGATARTRSCTARAPAPPVDAAVLGPAPPEIGSLREIQRRAPRRVPAIRSRQAAAQHLLRRLRDLEGHLERRVVLENGHGLLIDQRARIGLLHACSAGSRPSPTRHE